MDNDRKEESGFAWDLRKATVEESNAAGTVDGNRVDSI